MKEKSHVHRKQTRFWGRAGLLPYEFSLCGTIEGSGGAAISGLPVAKGISTLSPVLSSRFRVCLGLFGGGANSDHSISFAHNECGRVSYRFPGW